MLIARQLKENNIAEYLLYLWQVEDLIRANDLDIDKLKSSIISKFDADETTKNELIKWYEELIGMMREEGVTQTGHLQINENVLIHLLELHEKLLRSPRFPFYHSAYYGVLPYLAELKAKSGKEDTSGLRTCFELLYGVMLLKLQKKEISKETLQAAAEISKFLSQLAGYDLKIRKGELKLED